MCTIFVVVVYTVFQDSSSQGIFRENVREIFLLCSKKLYFIKLFELNLVCLICVV